MRRCWRRKTRPEPVIMIAGLLLGIMMAPVARPSSPGQSQAWEEGLLSRLEQVLNKVPRATDRLNTHEWASRIADLGPAMIPLLVQIRIEGRLPDQADGVARELTLSPSLRSLITLALGMQPRSQLLSYLQEHFDSNASEREAQRALLLLGDIISGRGIESLHDLALVADPDRRRTRNGWEQALRSTLARDPAAYDALRSMWNGLHAELKTPAMRSVSVVGGKTGLLFLLDLLERPSESAILVLPHIQAIAARFVVPPLDVPTDGLRIQLQLPDSRARAMAACCLGLLASPEAIPDLIELMDPAVEEPGEVRQAAAVALAQITGLRLGMQFERWNTIYNKELAWWNEQRPQLVAQLQTASALELGVIINEYLRHELLRDDSARDLMTVLDHTDVEIRILTCRALGQLAAPVALAALVDRLEDADSHVWPVAHESLVRITGQSLPSDFDAWRSYLGYDSAND